VPRKESPGTTLKIVDPGNEALKLHVNYIGVWTKPLRLSPKRLSVIRKRRGTGEALVKPNEPRIGFRLKYLNALREMTRL
jgi:hypothetical protein